MRIIHHDDNNFAVEGWHRSQFLLLSTLPGRRRWKERLLVFEPTGANIEYIRENWPDAIWEEGGPAERLSNYLEGKQTASISAAAKEAGGKLPDPEGYRYQTEPYTHQHNAFILSRDRPSYGLFFEQGCGKTKPTIDTAAYLYEKGEIDALVVIAPNGVHRNWVDNEVPVHLPARIPHKAAFYSSNMTKAEARAFDALVAEARTHLTILAFHIEGFVTERAQKLLVKALASKRCLLVVDESSRIANHSAKRSKFLHNVAPKAPYRRILTGTPIRKGAENLFSQFKFLDPDALGFSSFYTFRNHYCITGGFQGRQIVGYKNLEDLQRRVDGYAFRVLKADVLDLPPKVYKRIPFEMSPEQRKAYNSMARELVAEYEGEETSASIILTQMLRLHQIACGWWPGEDGEKMRPFSGGQPRMDALWQAIEESTQGDGKVIIWSKFKGDVERISEELGKEAVRYDGSTSEADRARAIKLFQNPKSNIRYFVAHPQAAGIGLTLTAAETAIYYSNSHDLELRLQSEDRCHRIGTKRTVTYIDLEAVKTVDRKIINSLRSKKSLADTINGDPASAFLEDN